MPQRSTLVSYYRDLLATERQPAADLIAAWPAALVQELTVECQTAYQKSALHGTNLALEPNSTSQSTGNQVEKHFAPVLGRSLPTWQLTPCPGAGYPDRVLSKGAQRIPLEFKSTGQWDDRDTNRCVLTSSSAKLRTTFTAPIHHLLVTAKFTRVGDVITFCGLRLDFLNPDTPVNVRFEGSVSQRLLASAPHPKAEFPR